MTLPVIAVADTGNNTPRSAKTTTPATGWSAGGSLPTFSNGNGSSWAGIAYSPELNLFVAIAAGGDNNNNAIATSSDGVAWTGRTCPDAGTWFLQDICWSAELSLFVIVSSTGPTTTKRILTSPDGINWTERTVSTASKNLRCVCWSPDLNLFVALGDDYSVTSSDGMTWTDMVSPPGSSTWQRIVWCDGSIQKFVACGRGTNILATSGDGLSWSTSTSFGGESSNTWSVAWSHELGIVAVVRANSGAVSHSTDASNWTSVTTGLGADPLLDICWSKDVGAFVAVCASTHVVTSVNGTSWVDNVGVIPASQGWKRVTAGSPGPPQPLYLSATFEDGADLGVGPPVVTPHLECAFTDDDGLAVSEPTTTVPPVPPVPSTPPPVQMMLVVIGW